MAFQLNRYFPHPAYPVLKPFRQNGLLKLYIGIFIFFWIFTGATATDFVNWVLENSLTLPAVFLLCFFYRKLPLSNSTYTLILLFVLLHLYGSQNAYAKNPFGYWLMETFHTSRNHYDRIVHFSFGFLLAYPMREAFLKVFNFPKWVAWLLPIEIVLSVSGFYELIEWAVAELFFPAQGVSYLGTQGDVWDAQKDIFLAFTGAILATTIVSVLKKVLHIQEKQAVK